MAARNEQIGERAGHDQAVRVLFEPAIAHLGKTKHSLDHPDCMFDLGPHFGTKTVLATATIYWQNRAWRTRRKPSPSDLSLWNYRQFVLSLTAFPTGEISGQP